MENQKIFICECNSYEHQAIFWFDKDENEYYITIHLVIYDNFFKRLWKGLKYAFGYTSKFGEWDEFLFKSNDIKLLKEYLKPKHNVEEKEDILKGFCEKISKQSDCPSEFIDIVNKEFWNLLM